MAQEGEPCGKTAAESFGEMLRAFGNSVSEIFDDPELRMKAKEFSQSAVDAAMKVVEGKVKDDEMRARFRKVGEAAQDLGKTLQKHFKN